MTLCIVAVLVASLSAHAAEPVAPGKAIVPLLRTVDLNVGQQSRVTLSDGRTVAVKLLALRENVGALRHAVRGAEVDVEVDGQRATLGMSFYHLPTTVGRVQIDCAASKGLLPASSKRNVWALESDARLRLWPAKSPWIRPGTFMHPTGLLWFSSDTQMANVPCYVNACDLPSRKSIYYHYGLDTGGADGLVPVRAATDGIVVSVGGKTLDDAPRPPVAPRYDVIYLRDRRGWYYRYSHFDSIDPSVKLGDAVKMGQRLGTLGKEGGSGGWSHLHFDISARQANGAHGIVEGYAFFWQVAVLEAGAKLQAVARPHVLALTAQDVTLDGSRSWSAAGPKGIREYRWTLSDGRTLTGPKVRTKYAKPGRYSEILRVTDAEGRVSYDFAVVDVFDRAHPDRRIPGIHAAYWPTTDLRAGQAITFLVRSFSVAKTEGHEEWHFGDHSKPVRVQSDGNADHHAKDGYARTTHTYKKPGTYLVHVSRTNARGETATARLCVTVGK